MKSGQNKQANLNIHPFVLERHRALLFATSPTAISSLSSFFLRLLLQDHLQSKDLYPKDPDLNGLTSSLLNQKPYEVS